MRAMAVVKAVVRVVGKVGKGVVVIAVEQAYLIFVKALLNIPGL